jgi:DNA-directed RNA polymerase subunit N (RpoN/RPB10)
MHIIYCIEKFRADLAVEQGRGLKKVSKEELRCVVCGKKLQGKSYKIYRSQTNEELKLCVCFKHKDYIKTLDALGLPFTENNL